MKANKVLDAKILEAERACIAAGIEKQPWRTAGHKLSIAWWKLIQERIEAK